MLVYYVGMFENGDVIATYFGEAQSTAHAKVRCIQRAAKAGRVDVEEESVLMSKAYEHSKLDGAEESALMSNAHEHSKCSEVDTGRWTFAVTTAEALPL